MRKYFFAVIYIAFLLIPAISIFAETYDLKKFTKSDTFPNNEIITVNTSQGIYRIALSAPPKGSILPANTLLGLSILPPDNIDPWFGKLNNRFSMAPGIGPSGCLIYHDLEGQGLSDFCSITYRLTIEKGFNVNPEVYYFELKLPDEVAEEILKILMGDTKWKRDSRYEPWYKLVTTPQLKGQNY